MEWYYVEEGERIGPVSEADLQGLIQVGTVTDETLVWADGMTDWLPYSQVKDHPPVPAVDAEAETRPAAPAAQEGAPARVAATLGMEKCVECGGSFSTSDMIHHGESWICAACKPKFLQRIKEGVSLPGTYEYGGFWIRVVAKILDSLVMMPVNAALGMMAGLAGVAYGNEVAMIGVQIFVTILNMCVMVAYNTWMVGRWDATLGKMACGLKVIMADGEKVSYGRACGRSFAEMLSSMTCSIGYIIAAFDDEKRTLHDHICNTRVVKK